MQVFSFIIALIGVVGVGLLIAGLIFWLTITSNGQNPFR
jgi:hypothetical protein